MRLLLIAIGSLALAGCDPVADAGADGGACEAVCLSGELLGPPELVEPTGVTLRAGWWGNAFEGTRTGITGGFTSASVDACDYVSRWEAPGDSWSMGFFLFGNELDATGDGLPDPGTYPVIPGWGGAHTEARGIEIVASWDQHGGGAEWIEVGADGWVTIEQIDGEAMTAEVSVTLRGGGGHMEGRVVALAFCNPL